jgi:hypothetical protein
VNKVLYLEGGGLPIILLCLVSAAVVVIMSRVYEEYSIVQPTCYPHNYKRGFAWKKAKVSVRGGKNEK